jgi:hypothetical protein
LVRSCLRTIDRKCGMLFTPTKRHNHIRCCNIFFLLQMDGCFQVFFSYHSSKLIHLRLKIVLI